MSGLVRVQRQRGRTHEPAQEVLEQLRLRERRRLRVLLRTKLDECIANSLAKLKSCVLAVLTKVVSVKAVTDGRWVAKDRVQKDDVQVGLVVDVHVGPVCVTLADHACLTASDGSLDEQWDLDGDGVHDALVNELVLGDAVDGGGKDNVCASVACVMR